MNSFRSRCLSLQVLTRYVDAMNIYTQLIEVCKERTDSHLSSARIRELVSTRFGTNPSSVIPSDYCYNRLNRGIAFKKHLFVRVGRSEYKYVGPEYPYSGRIYSRPKGVNQDRIVGEWKNGKCVRFGDIALQGNIRSLAYDLNAKAEPYQIGRLQDLRKELKGFARRPGNSIFTDQTIFEKKNYAFHYGGRSELQFNIGFDPSDGNDLRHGIAFSFETNQTLPDLDVLRPKVRLFNEFLALHPTEYLHMKMWHWDAEVRSDDYMPSAIPTERIVDGVFVFLGLLNPIAKVDSDQILRDFDDLLPLYKYVESNGTAQPVVVLDTSSFKFRPGCTVKKLRTTARKKTDPIDVSLRHNSLQLKLYELLVAEFGNENVGTELKTGNGTRVDVVVRHPNDYWFYEIKTHHSPRACIRDAIGQLLEYSHWPNGVEAVRLIVVGENPLDADGRHYLNTLESQYSLPIEYRQVEL